MLNSLQVTAMRRIRNIGYREIAIAAVVVVLIVAGWYAPSFIKHWSINKQDLPVAAREGLSPVVGKIEPKSGNVLLATSGQKQLNLDTTTLNLQVVDAAAGTTWNSLYLEEGSGDIEKSPLVIKFLGKDGTMTEWDAFKYAIQNGRYELNQIENGVQIVFDFFETESYRLNEYMPDKISEENYKKEFVDPINEGLLNGEISMVDAQKYNDALSIMYQLDQDNDLYFNKFAGLPPTSLVKDLINLSKAVGYTTEMLMADSQQFGIQVTITEPARFVITMEATLDNGDFVVKVPTYEIKGGNQFYTLQNIAVLPSFGLASADKVSDGYIVVPDGSGALFKLNSFNGKFPEYERPVYDNTYYDKLYDLPEFPENLTMPVFGMYDTDQAGKSSGYLGIIDSGAELGNVKVQLGTQDTSTGGTLYNKVYSSLDAMQFSRVKVFGAYSDNEARFLSTTGLINVDYTVRYRLFSGEVSYYDMAKSYQQHLIDKYDLKQNFNATPKLFLDVIGTVTLDKRFLGVPYTKPYSMTKYDQLLSIMNDLQDVNKVVNYKGFFNGGLNNTIMNKADLTGANGSRKELNDLMDYFKQNGSSQLFLNADLMRVSDTSDGFWLKSNALHGYDGKPIGFKKYDLASGMFSTNATKQYLLYPLILSDTVNKFVKDSEDYPNIAVNDMGSTYYANYNPRDIIDPVVSNAIVEDNLKKLAESKTIALDNPNMDRIQYSQYAANISRESSNYGTMYMSIPFRQLVMNGLTEYTTLNVNMSADRSSYYLLQALELGSIPKYTISAENVDVLKNSEYSDYISIQYSAIKDGIKSLYAEYSKGLEAIGSKEITGHQMLAKNVFETTYASGSKVIVNYNKYDVTVAGHHLDALGYAIESK
ncbi:hypothetical protein PCCS19_37130 [Paenibacillus sp. CCS19]|uniref:DUF5696 domain-containing protein n=1 Tax=Paenibacillus sp. CCS19 TaxID=3158387 RepID=UPI0025655376|nr:DUF5696 domain-containing protein [Paenibacillus cellulosilyticus]GMK40657.1 hypothetical protein PCCS19_37130 [Paenibacillus cellulosilyticus]